MKEIIRRMNKHSLNMQGLNALIMSIIFLSFCGVIYSKVILPEYNKHAPILSSETLTFIDENTVEGTFDATYNAVKNLDCMLKAGSPRGEIFVNGQWLAVQFERVVGDIIGDQRVSKSKSVNKQNFGIWRWTSIFMPEATHVRGLAEHLCNPIVELMVDPDKEKTVELWSGDLRTTINGPFELAAVRAAGAEGAPKSEPPKVTDLH